MKNKNNYFGFSKALMLEDIKLHWYLPAIIFSMYFLSGIFPLIITKHNGSIARAAMWNYNPGLIALLIFAPIIVSCVMMGFYHRPTKSFALYSQPYSKSKLFNTQILTGWLMIVVPIVLTGLCFLMLMGSVEQITEAVSTGTGLNPATERLVDAYDAVDVLIWVAISVAKMSFFYFLYTLVGALVGSTVMQILCSIIFVNIIPAVVGLATLYSGEFVIGYNGVPDWASSIIRNSNPLMRMVYDGAMLSRYSRLPFLWYFAAGVVFFVIAKAICSYGKLERVGDSMIFDGFESGITAVVAAVGGAVCTLIFSSLIGGHYILVAGAAIGLLLTFFVARIVIERSVKIFSSRNLRTLISSAVLLAAFLLIFAFDVVGYSTRTVSADKIKSVATEELIAYESGAMISPTVSNAYDFDFEALSEDRETIEKVVELNRYIIDNKLCKLEKDWEKDYTIIFSYRLKSGGQWIRKYHVSLDEKAGRMLQEIMTSDAVVEARAVTDKLKDRTNYINIGLDIDVSDNAEEPRRRYIEYKITEKQDITAFLEAWDRDIREADYLRKANYSIENEPLTTNVYVDVDVIGLKGERQSTTIYFYFDNNAKNLHEMLKTIEGKYTITDEYY